MKKQWLPLVFAVFVLLAPVASADGDSALSSFERVIAQIVALIVGDVDEIGEVWPPVGATTQPGDEQEIGEVWPPWG
jgi:hypothetical protein